MAQAKVINGIVGSYRNSDIDKVSKQTTVNMFVESQGEGASSSQILRSICGTTLALDLPEKNCRGMYRVSRGFNGYPVLYAVFGSHLYLIQRIGLSHFEYVEIGKVSNGTTEPVSMCETNGYGDAHPHLVIADGARLFAVDVTLLPVEQPSDYKAINLPFRSGSTTEYIRPSHVAYLYGYLAVLDQGTDAFVLSVQYPWEEDIYGDDIFMLEDHTITEEVGGQTITSTITGNPQGFKVYSEWNPDTTRALISGGSFLYTFGDRSFQVFSYHDDVKFPFQSPDTAAGAIGILAPRSVVAIGQSVFWLGSSDIGQFGIFTMTGSSPRRISTYDIEREISKFRNPADAVGQTWQENKHVFYGITFRSDDRTFVYDLTEDSWSIRSSYRSGNPTQEGRWRPLFATLAYDKLFFATIDDSKLIYQNQNKWTEWDDLPIVRRRRSGVILQDFSPFYCNSLKLIMNNGDVPIVDFNPEVMMRFSWNGSDWSDQVTGLVGFQGNYNWNTEWWNLGFGEILTVEISTSAPFGFAIVSAKVQVEQSAIL